MVVRRMLLDYDDDDYIAVSDLFNRHRNTKDSYLQICAIERVDNPVLERVFQQKLMVYKWLYGHCGIVKLFHGTKKTNIPSILQNNFEVERHGLNIGHRFGAGVSFSAFASYASHYCDQSEGDNQMLLCQVLISNIIEVRERQNSEPVLRQPPLLEWSNHLRYDTTAKDKRLMDVIVKFDDDSFLPCFIIHFIRCPKPTNRSGNYLRRPETFPKPTNESMNPFRKSSGQRDTFVYRQAPEGAVSQRQREQQSDSVWEAIKWIVCLLVFWVFLTILRGPFPKMAKI